jgi:DNA polymerase III subunit alpha
MTDMQYNGPSEFVHLHCHTVFSILDGVASPEQYFSTCKERGWTAIAITEHGNLASVPDNYIAAQKHGVKYIPGCEIYFNDYEPLRQKFAADGVKMSELKQTDPALREKIGRNRHITLYAKNKKGFENLVKVSTQAYETGMFYKPRVWFDKLLEYKEGLAVASGCMNGPASHAFLNKDKAEALDYLRKFKEAFGDDFYVEVQMPCLPEMDDHIAFATLLAAAGPKYLNINVILTNDSHYLEQKDVEIQKVMMAIDQGVQVDDPNLFQINSSEQYLKTRAELYETFKNNKYHQYATDADFEMMCNNTLKLAETCEDFEPDLAPKVPLVEDADNELREKVIAALKKRGLYDKTEKYTVDNRQVTYLEQATLELDRFIRKGFASYFLITADIVEFSIKHEWPVGPRGSAGGSLVNYLLGISEVDPLIWGLSFDRFLSAARGGDILNIKAE